MRRGSEHVIGTCDENGNLAIQPRASRDTGTVNFIHVDSYGAIADADLAGGGTPNADAFERAIKALDFFTQTGTTASIQSAAGGPPSFKVAGLSSMDNPNTVGQELVITGAASAANNGIFLITAVNSASEVIVTNHGAGATAPD